MMQFTALLVNTELSAHYTKKKTLIYFLKMGKIN